jgi:hypothetical protein
MANTKLGNSDYIYIFHHIPKSGGSSFKKLIKKNFKKEELFRFNFYKSPSEGDVGKKVLIDRFKKYISKMSIEEVKKIKFLYGQGVPYGIEKYFGRPARYIVFLRNPESRIISWYNYLFGLYRREKAKGVLNLPYSKMLFVKGKVPSFQEWARKKYGEKGTGVITTYQHLARWGYLRGKSKKEIKEALDKFYFIGITNKLQFDLNFLSYVFGFNKFFIKENISKRVVKKLTNKSRDYFQTKNKWDELIYDLAQQKRKEFIDQQPQYYTKVKLISTKRRLFLPFTQMLFDTKGTIIELSALLRRRSKMYEKYFDILRGYK